MTDLAPEKRRQHTAMLLGGVAVVMFGFGFAIAPLYSLYCKLVGVQTPGNFAESAPALLAVAAADDAAGRLVTVRFDANVADGLPWEFTPLVRRLEARTAQSVKATFLVRNRAPEPVTGRALANVVPWQAGRYFNKTECFCFQEQVLQPGESREMTVRFLVSPELPQEINSLTLSYTFMNPDAESAKRYAQRGGGRVPSGEDVNPLSARPAAAGAPSI